MDVICFRWRPADGGTRRFGNAATSHHRCDLCGKMLSTKLTLKRHKEQQHLQPLNNAVCHLCQKVFRTLNSLNNHRSIYHRRQKWTLPTIKRPLGPATAACLCSKPHRFSSVWHFFKCLSWIGNIAI